MRIEFYCRKLIFLLFIFCNVLVISKSVFAHTNSTLEESIERELGLLQFIANEGQWEEQIQFKVPMNNGSIFMESNRFTFIQHDGASLQEFYDNKHGLGNDTLTIKSHVYQMEFVGANYVELEGKNAFQHYYNYFIGNNSSKWASKVRSYEALNYNNLYPGIDLELMASESGNLKYQFRVSPGTNPNQIAIAYNGIDNIWLDGNELHYNTLVHEVKETNLIAYQNIDGKHILIDCKFVLNENEIRFEIGEKYNDKFELVIDPELIFSSFTGSFADNFGFTATYDESGNLYAGGIARSNGYPTTTGAIQTTYAGGVIQGQFTLGFNADMSISKFSSDGSQFLYSTYLGGRVNEQPHSLIVNENDELYIFGRSNSNDFPVSANAFDASHNGGMDIVVSKINVDGTQLMGSTYIGGTANDGVNVSPAPFDYGATFNLKYNYADDSRGEILLDNKGGVYVAAATQSSDFPLQNISANNTIPNAFGGGQDACVFELTSDLDSLIWSTYLGGSNNDAAYSIAFDDSSNLYLCGGTVSTDFPITPNGIDPLINGGVDGFIMKINSSRDTILNSTYFGTQAYDQTYFIDLDGDANVYVLGQTEGSLQSTPNTYVNPNSGIFILGMTTNLDTLRFQTTIGSGNNLPLISPTAFLVDDVCKSIYLCGWGGADLGTGSVDGLPVTSDAFVGTSDGDDFYLMVLSEDAQSLEYATFMGGLIGSRGEHVDGGTSRFDKSGVVYQSVCAGCGGFSTFPTTPGVVSNTNNSSNCNLAAFKFNINFLESTVNINTQNGCVPLDVQLEVDNPNADYISWDMGDGTTFIDSTQFNYTYTTGGNFNIMLISIDSTTCPNTIFIDTVITQIVVLDDTVAALFDTTNLIDNCDSLFVQFNNNSLRARRYRWFFGDGASSTQTNPTHAYTSTGTYEVVFVAYNDSTCNQNDTARISLDFDLRLNVDLQISDTIACIPAEIVFYNQTAGLDTFWWSFSNGFTSGDDSIRLLFEQAGQISVSLTGVDSNSCNVVDEVFAQVNLIDDSVFAAFDTIQVAALCDSLVLDFNNNSQNATNYIWVYSDGELSSLFEPRKVFNDTGVFEILLVSINENSCNVYDTAVGLAYAQSPVLAGFNVLGDCYPFEADVNNESFNAINYQWYFEGLDYGTDTLPNSIYLENQGTYDLKLIAQNPNTCNKIDSITQPIYAYGYPSALFSTDTNVYPIARDIRFQNNSYGAVFYEWDFGDGAFSESISPIHQYELEGLYQACLIAKNEYDCTAEYCKEIEMTFRAVVGLPNAFSPNGDGANDILFVKGFGVDYIELKIYNRWGELVFESNSMEIGWDGTYKGKAQEQEVYTYTLKAWFRNGTQTELQKGNITLLR